MPQLAAFALVLPLGCKVAPYACDNDAECGEDGQCEVEGWCGYLDDACPSGRRFGRHSGGGLAGECVPERGQTGTAGSDGAASDDAPTGSATTAHGSTMPPVADSSTASFDGSSTSGPATCGLQLSVEVDTSVLSPSLVLDGYPLLLSVVDAALVGADPETMFVATEDGAPLAHERESFDPMSGAFVGWVRLPAWTEGNPLVITLAWGDPASVPDVEPGAVWAGNFVGVWHLGDAFDDIAEGEIVRNAVTGGGHGFAYGGMTSDQSVAGAIRGGVVFDGEDDYVEIDAPFVGALEQFTVSYWARWDGESLAGGHFGRLNGDGLQPRCWSSAATGGPYCQLRSNDQVVGLGVDGGMIAPGAIIHMAFSWDGEIATTYLDGELASTNAMYPGVLASGTETMLLGRETEFGTFIGMLDEFRVTSQALPAEWIRADYRAQTNPANVVAAVGAAEPRPCR